MSDLEQIAIAALREIIGLCVKANNLLSITVAYLL